MSPTLEHRPPFLSQNMRFAQNQWYVVAGVPEVGREPLRRKVLGREMVLFRKEDGTPVAMSNWCPHRGFRLSDSKVIGDTIECGYHGMRFGETGKCTLVPSQVNVPAKMSVAVFPLVERDNFIWVWPGDSGTCDPALLPERLEFEDPGHATEFIGTLEVAANAAVAFENVIDITHASLLHPGILDTDNWELMNVRDEIEQIGPAVIQATKRFGEMAVKGFLASNMNVAEGTIVNRLRISREFLPALHTSTDIYRDAEDASKVLARRIRYVGITPQDERSCYLFAAYSSTAAYSDKSKALAIEILGQDVPALEATQRYFENGGDQFKEFSVTADRAALLARRIMANLANADENSSSTPRARRLRT